MTDPTTTPTAPAQGLKSPRGFAITMGIFVGALVLIVVGAMIAVSQGAHTSSQQGASTSTGNTAAPNGSDRAYQIGWKGGHILYNDGLIPEAVSGRCIIAANSLATSQQIEPTATGETIRACLEGYKAASNGN